ncbi:uncharacterized protein F5891DRAFT_1180742 [Suillus fuscotomentosus]|uniref:Uncharacterized protein n=1 Tax=Suillus fuscotomentosus TaxID=1912939 RepID=A0AAD4EMG2_9AGAM|nr:uncharacterized protein F5891DRAFT_1180742 [Suillus fuscotomentosus]KAG1907714.1 hypothetical protein F5891DRAFT_1180742 [Suillus fuscotomentosus]
MFISSLIPSNSFSRIQVLHIQLFFDISFGTLQRSSLTEPPSALTPSASPGVSRCPMPSPSPILAPDSTTQPVASQHECARKSFWTNILQFTRTTLSFPPEDEHIAEPEKFRRKGSSSAKVRFYNPIQYRHLLTLDNYKRLTSHLSRTKGEIVLKGRADAARKILELTIVKNVAGCDSLSEETLWSDIAYRARGFARSGDLIHDAHSLRSFMSFKYTPTISLQIPRTSLSTNTINWETVPSEATEPAPTVASEPAPAPSESLKLTLHAICVVCTSRIEIVFPKM